MSDNGKLYLGVDARLQRDGGLPEDVDGVDRDAGDGRVDVGRDVQRPHRRRERVRDQGRLPVHRLRLEHNYCEYILPTLLCSWNSPFHQH